MRVLFWSGTFWPHLGGVEVMAAHLLPRLEADFQVVTGLGEAGLSPRQLWQGLTIHRFPMVAALHRRDLGELARLTRELKALVSSLKVDLVHVNSLGPSTFFLLRVADELRVPWLATVHQAPSSGKETLHARVLERCRTIVCVSRAQAAELVERLPGLAPRVEVIPNGLPAPPTPVPPPSRPRLLCLGRMVPEKGFDVALEAFASLASRWPELTLTLAGDGVCRHDLEALAARLGVAGRAEFCGWVPPPEVAPRLSGSTALLVPSRSSQETFSLVALQAALAGRPVVASRVGGLQEVVEDGQTGHLVEPGDAGALARAVAGLLERSDGWALGRRARERAERCYSLDAHVAAYRRLYERTCS